MQSILQPPMWPESLSSFVTSCLMWDPKNRPTSAQALNHEYFADAVDPLRPKSSTSRLLGRKHSDKSFKSPTREHTDSPPLTSKPSWFRRSLIGRSESPATVMDGDQSAKPPVVSYGTVPEPQPAKAKPANNKRATWANGAPMVILPSIRPVSPLSNAITAQANSTPAYGNENSAGYADPNKHGKKIGRQLSLNSHGNHYADAHRQEAERALNGGGNSATGQKESFFSHLRKRARRLSGRNQVNAAAEDIEANPGCIPWSNRSSLALDGANNVEPKPNDLSELDKALQNVKYSLDTSSLGNVPVQITSPGDGSNKRQSMPYGSVRSMGDSPGSINGNAGPISSRTRRAMQMSTHPVHRYETPEEEDELLDEVLHSTTKAATRLMQNHSPDGSSNPRRQHVGHNSRALPSPYPTPSPSARCDGIAFDQNDTTPFRRAHFIDKTGHANGTRQWPTPPYDEGEWASSNYFAAESGYR